jgi:hypothetical protein
MADRSRMELLLYVAAVVSVVLITITSSACSNNRSFNLENHVGLYELVDKKCEVINNTFNPCGSTLFFELVKGEFSGIKDSELAYVFWSGDPAIDSELQYTTHLIKHNATLNLSNHRLWLHKDANWHEYLVFSGGKPDRYVAVYMDDKKGVTRNIEYSLKRTKRANHPRYLLSYPDSR